MLNPVTITDTIVTPLTVNDSTPSTPVTLVSHRQEGNPLETLIAATTQTENNDSMSHTILLSNLNTYADETFTDQVPDSATQLNDSASTPVVNLPGRSLFRVSYSDISAEMNPRINDVPISWHPI